jgi:hypothetical protein
MTETTDPTAAIEVWARMLCAADVHVHGEDHPTWQQLVGEPGSRIRDDYRKAAAWLLPKMTVAAKVPAPADRAAILREAADAAAEKHRRNPWTTAADVIAELRRTADEAQPTQRQIQCADAFWLRQPHAPHDWQQRPDAQPVRCPGSDEAQQPETQADGWHLTPQTLDLFVRALVNEVDYDIHKNYECGEEDGADHYPELVAEAAEMLNAITAEERTP